MNQKHYLSSLADVFSLFVFRSLRFAAGFIVTVGLIAAMNADADAQRKRGGETVPVILLHGIGGSDLTVKSRGYLYNGFPNDVLIRFLGDPKNLQFDENGEPRNDAKSESNSMEAIGFLNVPGDDIGTLSRFLQKNGYRKNAQLYEFAYDFRRSAPDIAESLGKLIEIAKAKSKSAKVNLVAHSIGGVIAKQYLLDAENAQNVETVIFVGTPHLGAPKALKALRYGDNLAVKQIDECKLKRAVHNMPSMFNLLPGARYFELNGGGYFVDDTDNDKNGVRGLLDYEQTLFNLANGVESRCPLKPAVDPAPFDRLSANLIEKHSKDFRAAQDNWEKPAGITVYSIVGYNVPTLKTIAETPNGIIYTATTAGDGTVPLISAETVAADQTYYADFKPLKIEHSVMIGNKQISRQILNLLQNGEGVYISHLSKNRPSAEKFTETAKTER